MRPDIDIIAPLDSLVKKIQNAGDIIIPIQRRGIRVLELSSFSQQLFDKRKLLFYDALPYHIKEMVNNRLILFDDGVNTGNTLNECRTKLFSLCEKKKIKIKGRIKTAALLINKNAEEKPDFKGIILPSDLYDYYSHEISYRILSTGKPLDVDHLIIKIEIPNKNEEAFFNLIQNKFEAAELSHSGIYDDVRMFSIDLNLIKNDIFKFFIPCNIGPFNLFDDGVKKIRIFYKENIAYIAPIIYPAMEISKNFIQKKEACINNDLMKNLGICLQLDEDSLQSSFSLSTICYNCIINILNLFLLREFLIQIKRDFAFNYLGVDENSIQVISHVEARKIITLLNENIIANLESNRIELFPGERAKKYYLKGRMIEKKVDFNINEDFQTCPEIVSTMVVNNNKRINEGLLFQENNFENNNFRDDVTNEFIGLSYDQIFDGINGMSKLEFSESIDVAVDTGFLKPIMLYQGIQINSENHTFRGIVRVYATAGEEVERTLGLFNWLFKKEG
jgi:hypoxanthine phosphoribosyltransferase